MMLPGQEDPAARFGQRDLIGAPVSGGGAADNQPVPLQTFQRPTDGGGVYVAMLGQLPLSTGPQVCQTAQQLWLAGGKTTAWTSLIIDISMIG